MAVTDFISRTDAGGLIPEPVTREIMEGAIANSVVLQMGRRLPNMTSKTQVLNVLDALPIAYWVDGDDGFKQTSKAAWDKKRLYAEELAVIVPIPENVLADSSYDIWAEIKPRLVEAFGNKIDAAVLTGTGKPASWRAGLIPSAVTAGASVNESADMYTDIMGVNGVIAKVEESGYIPTGAISSVAMRAKLRGLKDGDQRPLFKSDMQGATPYALDGVPMVFDRFNNIIGAGTDLIMGDFNQLVYAIRQDITYKVLDQATIVDPSTKEVVYSLAQQDMVALRCVMRLGWEIPNPINVTGGTNRFPFAILKQGE